jgi:hypothetical protein
MTAVNYYCIKKFNEDLLKPGAWQPGHKSDFSATDILSTFGKVCNELQEGSNVTSS